MPCDSYTSGPSVHCLFQAVLRSLYIETISYKSPIKKISGRIVGFGTVNPDVKIQVLDKPDVWSDDSLSFDEKRKRQSTVASVSADSNGKFEFRDIPKGSYEVEFSGKEGWSPLSVFVVVDPGAVSASK